MNPALWGSLCALSWGGADFAARYSGRALGHHNALLGMLLTGSVLLSLWVWLSDAPLIWRADSVWLLGVCGVLAMIMTLLLYWGLARGPVSVVAPIVGSYPALVVAFWVVLGARPSAVQWAAMAAIMLGVVIVARAAEGVEDHLRLGVAALRKTVLIALGGALAAAITVIAGQAAVPVYGELQTTWASRLVSLACLLLLFLLRRRAPKVTRNWLPVVAFQGLADSGGYIFLLAGSQGEGAALAAIVGSAFGVVTVLLARVFLREAMSAGQWAGIVLVFTGVALLAGVS